MKPVDRIKVVFCQKTKHAISWRIVTLWQWLHSGLLPWHSTKSNNAPLRPQHPVRHASPLRSSSAAAPDYSTQPESKLTLIFDGVAATFLKKHLNLYVVDLRVRAHVHATSRQGRRPSGENLGHLWSGGCWGVGQAGACCHAGDTSHSSPSPSFPLTPLPPDSRHSSTLQGLGCFEQPSWIEMRREKCRNRASWRQRVWKQDAN